MIEKIIVPLAVVSANGAALLTQLVIPRFLEPGAYTLFSVYWSAALFLSSLTFEWMRYGVLRYFNSGGDSVLRDLRASTLIWAYRSAVLALVCLSIFTFVIGSFNSIFMAISCVAFYALCQGCFEGYQAWQRSSGANFGYGVSAIVRASLSMIGALGCAYYFRSSSAALFGMALAFPLALIGPLFRSARRVRDVALDRTSFVFLAKFGFFAAAGSILSAVFPTVFRSVAAERLGLHEAAGLVLVADLSVKAVGVLGLAFNILLLQKTFKAVDSGSASDMAQALSKQIAVPYAVICPAAVGFFCLQSSIGHFLAPPLYIEAYFGGLLFSVCAAAVLGVRQYSLDPVFLAVGQPRMALLGPMLTAVALPVLSWLMPILGCEGVRGVALSVLIAALLGFLCSLFLIWRVTEFVWPWKDLLLVGVGCCCIVAIFHFVPVLSGLLGVSLLTVASLSAYFMVCFIGDFLGIRRRFFQGQIGK